MSNYDDIFSGNAEKKEKQSFDKDSWKQQKHHMESEKEVRVLLCPFPAERH